MASEAQIPETRVLAIASHVAHGYVGNKMATIVMQALGCDVASINTVNYSNHLAYKQVRGTKTTAEQIEDLYEGLKLSNLHNFDVLLSGYIPSAEAVQTVGKIGRDLKFNAGTRPGSFFWVLDPVMGDNGKLYIPEDEVPQYKTLLREADLILPNQFEAETLSGIEINDLTSLASAIQILHKQYLVPHIIITSLRLTHDNQTYPSRTPSRGPSRTPSTKHTPSESPERNAETSHPSSWQAPNSSQSQPPSTTLQPQPSPSPEPPANLTIIGSTSTSDHKPRLFRIDTPLIPLFFSGTGDMFAALTVGRLIEAVHSSQTPNLHSLPSWKSPDDVPAAELPLAKACEKVLASMQAVLGKTTAKCQREMKEYDRRAEKDGCGTGDEAEEEARKKRHLALMKASEVVVPRYINDLLNPPHVEGFRARSVKEGEQVPEEVGRKVPDELGVVDLSLGREESQGAIQIVSEERMQWREEQEQEKGQ